MLKDFLSKLVEEVVALSDALLLAVSIVRDDKPTAMDVGVEL